MPLNKVKEESLTDDLLIETIPFVLVSPQNAVYKILLRADFPLRVDTMRWQSDSGTLTANVKINSTSITGLSAVAVNSTGGNTDSTAANELAVGDELSVTFSSVTGVNSVSLQFCCARI